MMIAIFYIYVEGVSSTVLLKWKCSRYINFRAKFI